MTIIPAVPFGNAYWYSLLVHGKHVLIDPHENYIKQTYRNRFDIATSQGVKFLSVPTENQKGLKKPLRDIKIYNREPWKTQHLKSIEAAYNSSPFYLYFQDALKDLYHQEHSSLLDFNLATIQFVSECLDLEFYFQLADSYIPACNHDLDVRPLFKPAVLKKSFDTASFPRYIQVFEPKLGFLPNLSILDLLFNLGPETILYFDAIERD